MSNLHPGHVTPVLALEDPDACSPLVLRSAGYQAAKIIRKLTNDLGYAEQAAEAARLSSRAALEADEALLREAAEVARIAAIYTGSDYSPPAKERGQDYEAARALLAKLEERLR